MIRRSQAFLIGTFVAFLVAFAAFGSGLLVGRRGFDLPFNAPSVAIQPSQETVSPTFREQFTIFWDVWALVQSEFYSKQALDERKMTYGAIKGLLAALNDDYTLFQEPEAATQARESLAGRFEGIGAYLRLEKGQVQISKPIKNSPAMKAGLQSGDLIIKVDGQALAPLIQNLGEAEAIAQAASKIRGPKGSTVRLAIQRPTNPLSTTFDVPIVRAEVPLVSVNAQLLPEKVAYIQLTEFKATTDGEFKEALRELLPQKPTSLILDLRNNPGGFLDSAQKILGHFYKGPALYEEASDESVKELMTIDAPSEVQVFELPIVVLINEHSASAAEIVAGALRDRRLKTTLLGQKSFGKGSVQSVHQLRDKSSVRITIAHWLTPAKKEIHKIGIMPDFNVAAEQKAPFAVPCVADQQPPAGQTTCLDAQLYWGLRFLTKQEPPPTPSPTP